MTVPLLMFMRNYSGKVKMSKSTDGGETWGAITQTAVTDVYCQVAATHTNYNGKEYVILATAQGPGRTNGATNRGRNSIRRNDRLENAEAVFHSAPTSTAVWKSLTTA